MIKSWEKAKKKAGTDITNLHVLERIDPDWQCPVCGGITLTILDNRQNAVKCSDCGFPFSLPGAFGKGTIIPLPAHSDKILEERRAEWVDKDSPVPPPVE